MGQDKVSGVPAFFVKSLLCDPKLQQLYQASDHEPLLSLDTEQLSDESHRVSFSLFAQLLQQAEQATGTENIFCNALGMGIGSFGTTGYALMSAPNLQQWTEILSVNGPLLGLPENAMTLSTDSDKLKLYIRLPVLADQDCSVLQGFYTAMLLRLTQLCLDKSCLPIRADCTLDISETAQQKLGFAVYRIKSAEQQLSLLFPATMSGKVLPHSNTRLFKVFIKELQSLKQDLYLTDSWVHKVRNELKKHKNLGRVSQARVAENLGVGERTLARRLEEESSSYREIFMSVRNMMALEQLLEGNSVSDTAERLGYSERAAFERAFKKWQGITPVQFQTKFARLAAEKDILQTMDAANIPNLPESASKLLELLQDPECDIDELATLVEQDPILTAKLLAIANSGLYGHLKLQSVKRVILSVIGLNKLRALLMALLSAKVLNVDPRHFPYQQYWLRSLCVAELSSMLAGLHKLPPEHQQQCFLAGLLHNIGHLLLAYCLPQAHMQLVKEIEQDTNWQELLALQSLRLGLNSLEASEFFCRFWQMPEAIPLIHAGMHKPKLATGETARCSNVVNQASCLYDGLLRLEESEDNVSSDKLSELLQAQKLLPDNASPLMKDFLDRYATLKAQAKHLSL